MEATGEGTDHTDPFCSGKGRTFLPLVDIDRADPEFLQTQGFEVIVLTIVDGQQRIESGLECPFSRWFHGVTQINLIAFDRRVDQFGITYRHETIQRIDGIEETDLHRTHRSEPTHGLPHAKARVGLENLHDGTGVGRRNLKTYRVLISRRYTTLLCRLFGTARKAEQKYIKAQRPEY